MTSNTVPIYRHGRKYYVPIEEYERIRLEERRQRQAAALKSQRLPVPKSPEIYIRSPSTSFYNSIERSHSNPADYRYGVLKTPHIPVSSLINTANRQASNRLSRSTLKHYQDRDDLSSITPAISKKKISSPTARSNSSDKTLEIRRTPFSPDTESDIKRSFSAEIAHLLSPPPQPRKSRQPPPPPPPQILVRRSIPDYRVAPITTFSMTPNDHSHTQTNPSNLTNYFTRMKQSSLNPPSKPSSSAISGTGSFFESGIQGSDRLYTVLGSTNRRTGTTSSSLSTPPISNNSKYEYYYPDTASGTSFSDDNSSSLLSLIQRRNTDTARFRQPGSVTETDENSSQQRDSWTRSTIRSQSSDGLTEKKRVRFADMEGLTLETIPDRNRSLTRQPQYMQMSTDSRGQLPPFYHTLYQGTTKVGGSKLATDV